MKRFLYELSESWKIALAQMSANKTRSMLTALGVIIGIVAVTLMGTAINGISTGFDKSMSFIGDDVLYIEQRPWTRVNDWWNYRDRPKIRTEYADKINHASAATPNTNLGIAVPTMSLIRSVKSGDNSVDNVFILGTTADYTQISTIDCAEGRFFNEIESRGGAEDCVVGYDVADALFAGRTRDRKTSLDQRPRFQSHRHARPPGNVSRPLQSRLDRHHSAAGF